MHGSEKFTQRIHACFHHLHPKLKALQRCSSSHAHANERPQRRLAWPTARLGPLGVVFRIVQGCGGAGAQRCEHRELPRHADSADRGAEGSRSSSTAARGGAAQSASARRAVVTNRPRRSLWSARGDRYVSRRCGAEESLRRQSVSLLPLAQASTCHRHCGRVFGRFGSIPFACADPLHRVERVCARERAWGARCRAVDVRSCGTCVARALVPASGLRCRVCAARHCERPPEAQCMILSCIPVLSVTLETTAATTGRAGRSPVGVLAPQVACAHH